MLAGDGSWVMTWPVEATAQGGVLRCGRPGQRPHGIAAFGVFSFQHLVLSPLSDRLPATLNTPSHSDPIQHSMMAATASTCRLQLSPTALKPNSASAARAALCPTRLHQRSGAAQLQRRPARARPAAPQVAVRAAMLPTAVPALAFAKTMLCGLAASWVSPGRPARLRLTAPSAVIPTTLLARPASCTVRAQRAWRTPTLPTRFLAATPALCRPTPPTSWWRTPWRSSSSSGEAAAAAEKGFRADRGLFISCRLASPAAVDCARASPLRSPHRLHLQYLHGMGEEGPLEGRRRYTLTHNDRTGELQLSIGEQREVAWGCGEPSRAWLTGSRPCCHAHWQLAETPEQPRHQPVTPHPLCRPPACRARLAPLPVLTLVQGERLLACLLPGLPLKQLQCSARPLCLLLALAAPPLGPSAAHLTELLGPLCPLPRPAPCSA